MGNQASTTTSHKCKNNNNNNNNNTNKNSITIKKHCKHHLPATSFDDSNFTLISPTSTLSDPSNIGFRANPPLQRTVSRVVTHNSHDNIEHNSPLLKHKIRNNKKDKKKSRARYFQQVLTGCLDDSAQVAEQLRLASAKAVSHCVSRKEQDQQDQQDQQHQQHQRAIVKPNVTILRPSHSTRPPRSVSIRQNNNNNDNVVVAAAFQRSIEETPKMHLDQVFSTTLAFHQEEDYFDRLATGSHDPSPYIHNTQSMPLTPEMVSRRISDFDIHSFAGVASPCLTLSTETHFDNVATPAPIRALHPDESALLSLYTDGRTQLDISYMGSPVSAMMAMQKREKSISDTFMIQHAIVETVSSPVESMEGMSPMEASSPESMICMSPMEAPTPQPSIFRTMANVSAMMDDSFFVDSRVAETTVDIAQKEKNISNSMLIQLANKKEPQLDAIGKIDLVPADKQQPVVVVKLCNTLVVDRPLPVVVQKTIPVVVQRTKPVVVQRTKPVVVEKSKTDVREQSKSIAVHKPRPVMASTLHPVVANQHQPTTIAEKSMQVAAHQSRPGEVQMLGPVAAPMVEKSKPVATANKSKPGVAQMFRPVATAIKSKPAVAQMLQRVAATNKSKPAVAQTLQPIVAQKSSHMPFVVEKLQPVVAQTSSHKPVVIEKLQPIVAEKSSHMPFVVEKLKPVVAQTSSHNHTQKVVGRTRNEGIQKGNSGIAENSLASYMMLTQSHDDQENNVRTDTHRIADSSRSKMMTRHCLKSATGETRDYRNIALSTSECSDIPDVMPIQSNELLFSSPAPSHRHTSRESPGMASVMSTPGSSPVPLLSRQCLSNAAFLFSPSYAGGNAEQLQNWGLSHSAAFSISTFASRCRLGSVSSRSQPSITIPVATTWDTQSLSRTTFSRTGWSNEEYGTSIDKSLSQNSKHVRFSAADDFYKRDKIDNCAVEKTSLSMPRHYVNPAIETKISDLSDSSGAFSNITFAMEPSRNCAQETRVSLERGGNSLNNREEHNGVVATPFQVKKNMLNQANKDKSVPTKSPMIRFRSAKDKFSNPEQKKTPAKKTPPKKFWNRTPKKSLVSARIADLNYQLTKNTSNSHSTDERSCIQVTRSNDEYESTHKSVEFEEMTTKSAPSQYNARAEQVPHDEAPVMEECVGQSILSATSMASAQSVACTTVTSAGESDDIFTTIRTSSYDLEDLSTPDDESVIEDTFANLLAQPTEDEDDNEDDETAPTVIRPRNARPSNQSSAQSSLYTMSTAGTYNSDKENSVREPSLNSLLKATSTKSQVNPGQVRQHNHHGLYLSPLQRTPLQARKWRSLAAAAQEKEKVKRFQKLGERSVNVPVAFLR